MRKILGIIVLSLISSCNVYAEILDLEKGVKIKIFNNYEYFEVPFRDYTKMNLADTGVPTSQIDQMLKDQESLGFIGTISYITTERRPLQDKPYCAQRSDLVNEALIRR